MKSSKVLPQGRRPHSRIDRKRYEEKDQMTINDNTIVFGHSPDADDAFMFFGFAQGAIDTGPYDVIVELEAQDIEAISEAVSDNIHAVKGVLRTITCVCIG